MDLWYYWDHDDPERKIEHYREDQIRRFGGNLVVNGVAPGSRAARMAFEVGDAIKRVNGKDVYTVADVIAALRDERVLVIEIVRAQNSFTLREPAADR